MVKNTGIRRVSEVGLAEKSQKDLIETLKNGQSVHNFSSCHIFPEVVVVWSQVSYSFHICRTGEETYVVRSRDDGSELLLHVKRHKEAMFVRMAPVGFIPSSNQLSTDSEAVQQTQANNSLKAPAIVTGPIDSTTTTVAASASSSSSASGSNGVVSGIGAGGSSSTTDQSTTQVPLKFSKVHFFNKSSF